ncbi:MAG: glycosyltransferase family 9 protein [Gammaproteobacteria bacterium]|nr:glycosyltransferase family 9 protein [Gammaproteobacteria bacterium]
MPDSHPLVCRFGAFGDMVLITPLLKQLYLRSGLPCDVIAIGNWNKLLFQQMPWVRQVFTIDSRSAPYWINRSQRELVQSLLQHRHQYAWVCETSKKSYRLLARAGVRRDNCITQLDLPIEKNEHYCEKWLRLGNQSPPGFDYPQQTPQQLDTELFVSADEQNECRQWLATRELDPGKPLICIQAGSKRTTRRGKADRSSNTKYWPEQNWAAVINGTIEHLPGAQVLLCGVAAELEMCRAIEALCQQPDVVQTIADDLPLRRLLALLSIAHSCISVDTGPAHAAAALNCPLVVLFGKANPQRFRPISAYSDVQLILGFDDNNENSDPDIGLITPEQVITAWMSLYTNSIKLV